MKFSNVSLLGMPAEKSFASLVIKPIIRALETWILEIVPTPDVMPFVVTQHRLELAGLERPLRMVQLTDLHFGPAQRLPSVQAWVNATLEEKPDLILITGDFLEYRKSLSGVSELCAELSRLEAPLGVFGVMGNHDLYAVRLVHLELTEPLERAGIRILTNTGFQVRDDVFVAGVDDLWNGNPDLEKALKDAPNTGAILLMSHHPDLLESVPARVSLTLCGHTHGGQIVLPWFGALHTGSKYGQKFVQGSVCGALGARGFVSRGLGTTALPVRYNCPAELAVFDLTPVSAGEN
jgi:uncharacterized protein